MSSTVCSNPSTPRSVLIAGGARGIGLAIARRLKRDGDSIAILDLDETALDSASQQIGKDTIAIECDISSESQLNLAIKKLFEHRSRIDVLINSAGITGLTDRATHDIPTSDFDRVVAINLRGSFLLAKAVLPAMEKQNFGRILMISSIAGKEGNPRMSAYSASKAGVIGLVKSLGKEYAQTGITINALAPAVIRTSLVDALPTSRIEYMTSKIPMGRCGTLEEAADLASFIVSQANSFTTGFCYDLSGGRAVY